MSHATHSDPHADKHAAPHAAPHEELPCEPDEVPVKFLTITAAGVTAVTLALIATGVWLFDTFSAAELRAKGYDVDGHVPVAGAAADPAPSEAAPE